MQKETKLTYISCIALLVYNLFSSQAYAINFFGSSEEDKDKPKSSKSTVTNTVVHSPASYADAVAKAAPSVVSIQTTKEIPMELHPLLQDPFFRFFFGEQGQGHPGGEIPKNEHTQQGLGSGVLINNKGYILTNNHVIKDTSSIIVKLSDGRESEAAEIVGSDPQTDLAVLKIKLKDLPSIEIGSSDSLRVGDVALAIGNPFGFERTVTQGIISATGSLRERTGEHNVIGAAFLDNLLQTDAAINPGNSGGALIDAYGRLIGINMAIVTRSGGSQGIGFAIPIDLAKNIMTQLIETGHIVRGWLGAHLSEVTDDMRKYLNFKDKHGVYVQATIRHSPAQRSGILPGDIITQVNSTIVKDLTATVRLIGNLKPDTRHDIEVFRKGDYLTFSVIIGNRPEEN